MGPLYVARSLAKNKSPVFIFSVKWKKSLILKMSILGDEEIITCLSFRISKSDTVRQQIGRFLSVNKKLKVFDIMIQLHL